MGLSRIISLQPPQQRASQHWKGVPLFLLGSRSSDYAKREEKKMGLLLCGRLKFHSSQLNFKPSWFWKAAASWNIFEGGRRTKGAQSSSEVGGRAREENVVLANRRTWDTRPMSLGTAEWHPINTARDLVLAWIPRQKITLQISGSLSQSRSMFWKEISLLLKNNALSPQWN